VVSVQTILVAGIGGLAGGLLGTWLQIRHERREAFRSRLIEAADDLATGMQQAMIALDDAHKTAFENGFKDAQDRVTFREPSTGKLPDPTAHAFKRSRELNAEAQARQARVALLFGPVSPADRSATLTIGRCESRSRRLRSGRCPTWSSIGASTVAPRST
jgi:hypothetical protein